MAPALLGLAFDSTLINSIRIWGKIYTCYVAMVVTSMLAI